MSLRRAMDGAISEKEFQEQVRGLARLLGWHVYHPHDSRRSPHGYPDLTMVHAGLRSVVWAELKAERGRLTADQQVWLYSLAQCRDEFVGVFVWRPSDFDTIEDVLREGPGRHQFDAIPGVVEGGP